MRTIIGFIEEKQIVASCFLKFRLLSGCKEVHQHFHASIFSAGTVLRDDNLPNVDVDYAKNVLSLQYF